MSEVWVCIHAHCYQPPRENPWLEEVEPEPSAHPAHDWNERITAECYAPNAAARVLDSQGRIESIRNNYASISFNFGPTLLGWMESEAPEAYAAVIEADAASRSRFGGHGSALAQPYNHMIMPLATSRDRRTQVAWGVADFKRRFRRDPEGMWLPETAVDLETLETLAEYGIRFTVLAPHQADRVRCAGGEWRDVERDGLDTTVAYRQCLPSGKEIALFFYDGPTSRAVAFESLLDDGETLASRLIDLARSRRESEAGGLVHIATDGETYGHHHAHGDMALAVALGRIEREPGVRLANYGLFLAEHPPEHEVQVREHTAWSCAHGVERWRSDCGCSTGGESDWDQAWRAPLRAALDALAAALDRYFEERADGLLREPWKAREAYIDAVLGTADERDGYVEEWCASDTSHGRESALRLLEMQRCAMLMFTSCGWFFNDLAGIETRQILRYAARALELAESLGATGMRESFLAAVSDARGNGPTAPDGQAVILDEISTAQVSAPDIAMDWVARRAYGAREAESSAWGAVGTWATAAAPDATAVAGTVQVTDRRIKHSDTFIARALLREPDDFRIRIVPEGSNEEDRSDLRYLEDLRPDTRAVIEATEVRSDGRSAEEEVIAGIRAAIETFGLVGDDADRRRQLAVVEDLIARAREDGLELALWELQNEWWRATRPGGELTSPTERAIAVCLGFAVDTANDHQSG
ncbi:MAG: DUF3536 domain-containing protein [Gemmatimonadetes bacterium]|nr:DUF3536 domain-containing protein [Gemmatimonadota bacterium]